jgi:hypothetical protein
MEGETSTTIMAEILPPRASGVVLHTGFAKRSTITTTIASRISRRIRWFIRR